MADTLIELNDLFEEVFDDDEIELSRETSAEDVDAWDSLMHVNLMIAAERRFGVKFSSSDVAALKNIGELVDLIDQYRAASA